VDDEEIGLAALFSIKPKFANAILEGVKACEFRRSSLGRKIEWIVIYATMPVGKIIGYVRVHGVDEASPVDLWKRYHLVGGISEEEFSSYFSGAPTGIAIALGAPVRFESGVRLSEISDTLRPPQSFIYLAEQDFRELLQLAESAT